MNFLSHIPALLIFAVTPVPLDVQPSRDGLPYRTFTSTVDWYRPPPKDFDGSNAENVPSELLIAVAIPLRTEASDLLGNNDAIELTKSQADHFSVGTNPDVKLEALIVDRTEQLNWYIEHPVEDRKFRERDLQQVKATHDRIINELKREVSNFRKWKGNSTPYLIKAVALWEGTGRFSGSIASDTIVVGHASLGTGPAPMTKVPVIAFLPSSPTRVYTVVSMAK